MTTLYNRRRLIRELALSATAITLVGCPSILPKNASQGAQDVELLAAGLTAILNSVKTIPGVPQNTITQISDLVSKINADAALIGQALVPQSSWVTEIANAVNALVPLVSIFIPQIAGIGIAIQAVLSLLPSILSFFGISVSASTASHAMAAPLQYTPSQARSILQTISQKGIQ